MNHGGPSPATRFTSVVTAAILRFYRPLCYQDFTPALLLDSLRDENPLKHICQVNRERARAPIEPPVQ